MRAGKKVILASSIGNILEFYDFALYGFFAPILAKLYFPTEQPITSLLLAYGVFAVSFFSRPFGAIIFGYIGDKIDRRTTLSLSLLGIAGATLLIGVLPTFEQWGIFAPLCLTFLRLIQGISLGGEFSNSLVFVSEHLEKLKSKYPSFSTGIVVGMGLIGWFAASYFSIYFSETGLSFFSWRVPFILGSLVAGVGIYIRRATNEAFEVDREKSRSFMDNFKEIFKHPRDIFSASGVGVLMGALFYGQFIFGCSFLPMVTNFERATIGKVISFGLLLYMLTLPLFGWIADKIGHKKVVITACFSCVLFAPLFLYLDLSSSLVLIVIAQALVACFLGALMAPGTFLMSTTFPMHIRCLGVSFSYNMGAALIGGTVPSINLFLYQWTDNPMAPSYFLAFSALLAGLLTMKFKPDRENSPSVESAKLIS